MFAKPQKEHEWLKQLRGKWTMDSECQMQPDAPLEKTSGSVNVRHLGDLWVLIECEGETPDNNHIPWTSSMAVGFDPRKGSYVGSFVASMMTHLWLYEGELDDSGNVLTLSCHGPAMTGDGNANYRDVIEIISPDQWTMTSYIEVDGTWTQMMLADHKRLEG